MAKTKIERTAKVARTAHDLQHLNRISLPDFGAIELWLEGGGARSKSYLLPGANPARAPSGQGSDAFCFAPGVQLDSVSWLEDPAKTDKVKIVYDIHNPRLAITSARLELFCRFKQKPIWQRDLAGEELLDGRHELAFGNDATWDGKIDAHAYFPDEYITAERSPYKLKLTLKGDGPCESPVVWTYFHVLVGKLELAWGTQDVLPAPKPKTVDHRRVLAEIVTQAPTPPAAGAVRIPLKSNLFKKGHSMFNDSLYVQYKKLWGDGPLIPLFLKIWVKDSGGNDVLAPRALGKLRFLWDWESKSVNTGGAVPFIDQAQDYEKGTTKPKGENCHDDRGGKRGGKKTAFPAQDGYAAKAALKPATFPFKVKACPKPRSWAALSYPWTTGKLASMTGVLFQPARQAGDAYQITAHVAYDVSKDGKLALNTDADAPLDIQPALTATTGTLTTWREVHLIRYLKKTAAVSNLTIATIQGLYIPAHLDLADKSGGATAVPAATWNTRFQRAMNKKNAKTRLMVDSAVDQHAAGPMGAYFRTRTGWRAQIAATTGDPLLDVQAWMNTQGLGNDAGYGDFCSSVATDVVVSIFDNQLSPDEGINIFHCDGLHDRYAAGNSVLRGFAHDFDSGTDRRAGYLQIGAASGYSGGTDIREYTASHEFGHHFFLPHTPNAGEKQDYKAHDAAVLDCLMSYNFAVHRKLCGFCILRLRGWSKKKLDVNGASNKKP